MDGTELDEIMNEAPASDVIPAAVDTPPQAETQPRDETGKFATKTQEAPAAEVDPDNAAQHAVEGGEHEKGKVPVAAVQAEREKARQAKDEAETLRQQIAELRGQVSVLTQQGQPKPTAEKPKPANFWEKPDEFLSDRLAPVQQDIQTKHLAISEMLAEEKFGAETLTAAKAALADAMRANPNDPSLLALDQQTRNSPHPFRDVINWHTKRQAMAEIGEDPAAYRTRIEAEIRAAILAEHGIEDPSAAVQQPAPSAPTTTKPLTKLPQSLSRIPGAGNSSGAVDTSDTGLFNDAMSGR